MSISLCATNTRYVDNQRIGQVADTSRGRQLGELLLGCIDEVLTDLLGRKVREAVYDHLARKCSLTKEQIPRHLNEFSEFLVKTFGKGGATLERRITARLYDTLGLEFADIPTLSLNEHVAKIRGIVDGDLAVEVR